MNSTNESSAELHFIDGAGSPDHKNHRFYASANGLVLDQPSDNYNTNTLNMFWANDGKVGIGTLNPTAQLEVTGNLKLGGVGASLTFPDGTVQSTAYAGSVCPAGGDYAESVDVVGRKEEYEPGDVLVLSSSSGADVLKSSDPYSTSVLGIYSTRPGYIGRRQLSDPKLAVTEVPMAMIGIVPTKVTADNGPIRRGDLLVTSSRSGYAMKGTDRSRMLGAIVGKALGNLETGTGLIEVAVTLQ